MKAFNQLPLNVQTEVKETLSAYSECSVWRKNDGTMRVTTGTVLATSYDGDMIGRYKAADIFTPVERVINYVREFRDFPFHAGDGIHYDGEKDYRALAGSWTDVEMVDGNLKFI